MEMLSEKAKRCESLVVDSEELIAAIEARAFQEKPSSLRPSVPEAKNIIDLFMELDKRFDTSLNSIMLNINRVKNMIR